MKTGPTAKRLALTLGIFISIVAVIAFLKYRQISAGMAAHANFAMPPEAVTSAAAREESWQHRIEAPGSLRSVQGVVLSAEASGKVVEIGFESGQKVEKNHVLVKLDVSVEQAQLKAAVARAEFAAAHQERIQGLISRGALSQKEIEDVESQRRQTRAEVEQLTAAIQHKTIPAPFTGYTGIRQVQLGQYVTAGTPIVPLYTLDPIYVNFTASQQDVSRIKMGQTVQVAVDSFPNDPFEGRVTAIDPQLDETMRTVGIQATLANPTEKLRPGMFAKVSLVISNNEKYVTLPATSIARATYGDSVYVIEKMKDPQGKEYQGVRQQFVKVGPYRGDQVAILSGLKAGEEVVTSGLFKLRPGAAVEINNAIKPGNKPVSTPADN